MTTRIKLTSSDSLAHTTRRYPRSLDEAFPRDKDVARWIDPWPRVPRRRAPIVDDALGVVLACCIGIALAVAVIYYS